MPIGLRAGDAPLLLDLTRDDRRLFMRLGALLQDRLTVTEAVLAECAHEPGLRKLLLDRRLKQDAAAVFTQLLAEHGCEDIGLVLHVDQSGGESWRVIMLEDELDNPLLAETDTDTVAPDHQDWHAPVSDLLPSLQATVRKPVESLLAAQADDQRAAALEQLRYAAPPMTVVSELMPMLLADGADVVRERAIALLVGIGVHPLIVDVIRALQRGDDATLERLAPQIPLQQPAPHSDLLVAAVITVLGTGDTTPGLIALATRLAPVLAQHRGLHRFLELLCIHAGQLAITPCIRALQATAPQAVATGLRALLGQHPGLDARLIVLLAVPEGPGDPELLQRGVDLLIGEGEEPLERMALAHALRRLDRDRALSHALTDRRHAFVRSRDATVYWLVSELAQRRELDDADGDAIAETVTTILKRGSGPHLVSILDQRLPAVLPCSDAHRADMVEPLAELAIRFRDDRSLELVEHILAHMGDPVIAPLWQLLEDHPQACVRLVAGRVLPLLLGSHPAAVITAAIRRLLAVASAEDTLQARITDALAAAQLTHHLAQDTDDLTREIDRACEVFGIQAIEAQACLAAGHFIAPERRVAILDRLLRLLTTDLPDVTTAEEQDPVTEQVTFVLDAQLGAHTDLVPRILSGLRVIAGSAHLAPQLFRRIVQTLIEQWRRVASWQTIWGPGNIFELARHLGMIAEMTSCPDTLRKQIAQSLSPRVTQLTIAAVLVRVLAAGQGKRMAPIAEQSCQRLIRAASRNEFADDERAELIYVLSGFLALTDLGEADARLRSQLVSLITSSRQHCDRRSRDRLRFLRDELPEHLAKRLDWA